MSWSSVEAHGATDVTGFGILGHANNLAKTQSAAVSFKIHTLPSNFSHIGASHHSTVISYPQSFPFLSSLSFVFTSLPFLFLFLSALCPCLL